MCFINLYGFLLLGRDVVLFDCCRITVSCGPDDSYGRAIQGLDSLFTGETMGSWNISQTFTRVRSFQILLPRVYAHAVMLLYIHIYSGFLLIYLSFFLSLTIIARLRLPCVDIRSNGDIRRPTLRAFSHCTFRRSDHIYGNNLEC